MDPTPLKKNDYRYLRIEQIDDAVVAQIVDSQLVGSISEFLRLEFRQLLKSATFSTLVIDFQKVKMISSSSIQSLLNARDRSLRSHVDLRLASMSRSVLYVFETLNLVNTVFEIFDSTEDALGELKKPTFFEKHGRYCPRYEDEDSQ